MKLYSDLHMCLNYCNSVQDLIKDLKSELTGNFENVIVSLMRPKNRFDAMSLRKAMKVQDETLPPRVDVFDNNYCTSGFGH